MPSILITGCSSGLGLATAKYLLEHGWRVVATMRSPRADALPPSDRLLVLPLDVTRADSIQNAIAFAGPIDVLVNNAGLGVWGAAESMPADMVRTVFETNTLGTITLSQAVLPQFRERNAGVTVNVTSTVVMLTMPWVTVYRASKAAVEAFSESLALEVAPFNVQVRTVLPGFAPNTRFGENAIANSTSFAAATPVAYMERARAALTELQQYAGLVTTPEGVATAVWRAATDPACPARLPAGADASLAEQTHRLAA